MRCFLWFMLVGLALAGLFTIYLSVLRLFLMATRCRRLVKAVGVIREIDKKSVHFSTHRLSGPPRFSFIPIIAFVKASGEQIEFRSEAGEYAATTKYRIGQSIDVLYDPDGVMPPMIDEWFARWGVHIVMIFGGLLFLGGSSLVYWIQSQPVFSAS